VDDRAMPAKDVAREARPLFCLGHRGTDIPDTVPASGRPATAATLGARFFGERSEALVSFTPSIQSVAEPIMLMGCIKIESAAEPN